MSLRIKEVYMNIQVTDMAREKILDAMKGTEFEKPALRLVFSGIG